MVFDFVHRAAVLWHVSSPLHYTTPSKLILLRFVSMRPAGVPSGEVRTSIDAFACPLSADYIQAIDTTALQTATC